MFRANTSRPLAALLLVLSALAWLALWIWGQSPYANLIDHQIHVAEPTPSWVTWICGLDANGQPVPLLVALPTAVAGWTLMTIAMMLPTSMPLITLFQRVAQRQARPMLLMGALLGGYLAVWAGFGLLAHLGSAALGAFLSWSLPGQSWVAASIIYLIAGAYQFTPLKHACLDQCRSPLSFLAGRWRGGSNQGRQAFRLGLDHGAFCVGCCWSLMLLMFIVGMTSLGWMLALGAVMAIEKNMPWGRRLSAPLGIGLLALGFGLPIFQLVSAA